MVKPLIRKNNRDQDEITGSHFLLKISEPLVAAVKFSSIIPLEDFIYLNWHINFIILINKKLLFFYLAMILPKTILTYYLFEDFKNLWHINSDITDYIYISHQ